MKKQILDFTRKGAVSASILLLSISTALSIVGVFDGSAYLCNLAAQFRWQYLLVQLISVLLIALDRQRPVTLLLLLLTAFNIIPLLPYVLHEGNQSVHNGPLIRVVQVNANSRNLDYERILDYLRKSRPDAFIVEELNPTLATKIKDAFQDYPFSYVQPKENPYGIGVFSKDKIFNCKFIELVSGGRLALFCTLQKDGQTISLAGAHLISPTTPKSGSEQIQEFEVLSKECESLSRPLILAGDFNSAPWTMRVQNLLKKLSLRDARIGTGLQCTWPSDTPIARIPISNKYERLSLPFVHVLFMLPIDHFFLSEELEPVRLSVGPNVGSDHYPVLVDIRLRK